MRRGEIWTVAGGKDHAGNPRPVVIVKDDSFDATESITVCAFTTDEADAPLFRLPVAPNERNGLRAACRLMVDTITTVPKTKVGARGQVRRREYSKAQPSRPRVSGSDCLATKQASNIMGQTAQFCSKLAEGMSAYSMSHGIPCDPTSTSIK